MRRPRALRPRGLAGLGREFCAGLRDLPAVGGLADSDDRTDFVRKVGEGLFVYRKCARLCSKVSRVQHHSSEMTRPF